MIVLHEALINNHARPAHNARLRRSGPWSAMMRTRKINEKTERGKKERGVEVLVYHCGLKIAIKG